MRIQHQLREAVASRKARALSLAVDLLTFLIGASSCASVKLIGSLPGSEILLLPLIPFLAVVKRQTIVTRRLIYSYALLGLWLFGQMMTDLYRQTELVNWIKGDAAIIFMGLDLMGLAALLNGRFRRTILFILGLSIGSLMATRISPAYYFQDYPWKFGYAEGVTSLVVLSSSWFFMRRQYGMVLLCFLGICGLHLYFNYRSPVLFLMVAMALVLPLVPERLGRVQILPQKGNYWRVAVLIVIALGTAVAAKELTTGLAGSGLLGEDAQQKNEAQEDSSLGLLFGARPNIFVSSRAVIDSPILGHGSYAKDLKYTEMADDLTVRAGLGLEQDVEANRQEVGLIPSHSHVMGAWVNAGILGTVFWIYVLILAVRGVVEAALRGAALAPWYVYSGVAFVWAVFFSPFGYTDRIWEAVFLVMTCDFLDKIPARAPRCARRSQGRQVTPMPLARPN